MLLWIQIILYCLMYPLLPAVIHQRQVRIADMQQDLVHHGPHSAAGQQLLQIIFQKIGYADHFYPACRLRASPRARQTALFFSK